MLDLGKRYSVYQISLFFIFVLFLFLPTPAVSHPDKPHILLINSYDQRLTWVEDIVRGVEDVLLPEENSYTLHIENMDSKSFYSPEYFAIFRDYLEVKYKNTDIYLILSSDDNAYDFLREHRDQVFPGVPVVFCGVNNFEDKQIANITAITGVVEVFSADTTVKLALQLNPEIKRIFIINDYLKTGRLWAAEISRQLAGLAGKIEFEYSQDLSLKELLTYVATLPADAAVLLGTYFPDGEGSHYTYEQIAEELSQVSPVPVFSLVEFILDRGIVGGQVISGYYQGRTMAGLAEKILQGEDVETLSVVKKGSNHAIFNYPQLERHGLDPRNLPQSAVLINKPFSFYETYRYQIWMVTSFILILLAVILALVANIGWRKRAERALRRSEKRLRQLADATWEALVIHDGGVVLEANEMFERLSEYSVAELKGKQVLHLFFTKEDQQTLHRKIAANDSEMYEAVVTNKSGRKIPVEVRIRYMEYDGKEVRVAAIRDLTRRKRLEEQLTQSRKLEAIGTLAGGIAHDFNNILSAIIGYSEILLLTRKNDQDTSQKLEQILNAGNRAKHLVQQILTFARKTKEQLKPMQLSKVVREVVELMRASLPASIKIKEVVTTEGCVLGDATKMHQLVMNLCTNAGKVMPNGGLLEVLLDEVTLDETATTIHPDILPGPYLRLMVKDTGKGISPDNLAKIFDPFFTTDEAKKGTGLGLAVVHGIVKECHGIIEVESTAEEGATFIVHLPKVECLTHVDDASPQFLPRGQETIMIIDDEQDLIRIGTETLANLGYNVQGFASSPEAVTRFLAEPDGFDLVITDLTMPEISGEAVARKFLALRSDLPVIVCSGYSETFQEEDARRLGVKRYLVKPVATRELALQVREVLDEAKSSR